MAKRSYRGKHPHNDMKVETASSTKYSPKLKTQYDKLKDNKQKYDFIKTNYYNPQATMVISGTADLVAASAITMSSANGSTLSIKGVAGATNTSNKVFKTNGTAAEASNGIRDIVNVQMGGKITASVANDIVTLKQEQPGPDGNSAFTLKATTIVQAVTFNGTAANNSASIAFSGG
jgi:hypothetical protein